MKKFVNKIRRGDIYFVKDYKTNVGSEQCGGRPAVVVSNDRCNRHSPVVEVVFLTSRAKHPLPTHVSISSAPQPSTALCEQVHSIDRSRFRGSLMGCVGKDTMNEIDRALLISLGLNDVPVSQWQAMQEAA